METIFISIASCKEEFLAQTIKSAISNADNPELLYFGITNMVIDQRDFVSDPVFDQPNVNCLEVKFKGSLGTGFGRMTASLMANQEHTYLLQVDAQNIFEKNWDTELKNYYKDILKVCEKPIISASPRRWIDGPNKEVCLNEEDGLVVDPYNFKTTEVFGSLGFRVAEKGSKDNDGSLGEIKAMGLDLKRADTPEFMQRFLEEILLMVLNGQDKQDVIDAIDGFRTKFKERPGWEKGTPKRVNNLTKHTEVFEKTGKCGVGHAMAAINWNRFKKAHGDQASLDITDGMKVIVCKLKSNPMGITSIAYPIDEMRLPDWFKEMPFDHGAMEETIINNKVENLIGVLDWDIRASDQTNTFESLFA